MNVHGNAKLGPAGRRALVVAIADGASLREAAAGFGVSAATAHRWWARWRRASEPQRSSLACLADRSSRPRRSPRLLSAARQERICAERRRTGWGPRLIAGQVGEPHSTVWKVLHRNGLSRPDGSPRSAARRDEWPCPGDLLHMDTKRYARFVRPGHAVTGDRTSTSADRKARRGYQYAHTMIDDHSRLADTELHPDEQADTVTGFVARALAWYAAHGVTARRLIDRQRLGVHQEPVTGPAASRPPRPPLAHPTQTPPGQRQGRALSPNHEPRMGLRRHLPRSSRPRPSAAILA